MGNLRTMFENISKLGRFLREERIQNFNGFFVLFLIIIAIGMVGLKIDNNVGEYLIMFSVFLFIILFYVTIPIALSRDFRFKRYILFGQRNSFSGIFREFSFYSYIVSLICVSTIMCIPTIGFSFGLYSLGINFLMEWIVKNVSIVFYTMVSIESVLWFAYHIVYETVDFQEIKIKLTLFSAVAATLLILIELNIYLKDFKLILTYLAGSFFWISFLIELKIKQDCKSDNIS
ncbi:hypothetical protein ACIQXI_14300 [Lysinibacillus sp. NPDC097195]|uniref:hypothetical protein n=1 Tax=Lysinibacillus sp. NPDC097195 TaxID=3364141 RepID=UPI0037F41C8D